MLSIINGDNIINFDNKTFYILEKDVGSIGVNISTSKGIGQNGEFYVGSNLNAREITIKGAIWGRGGSIEAIKKRLIKAINPFDTIILNENGYTIQANAKETVKFSVANSESEKDYIEFLITLYCCNPFWTNEDGNILDLSTWINNFSFELEIPNAGIELGVKVEEGIKNLYNNGDIEIGVEITLTATSEINNPKIFNIYNSKSIKLNYSMSAGEIININTNYGKKRIESNIHGNIINFMDFESEFIQLDRGDNWYKLESDNGVDNLLCTIKYNECIFEV